MSLAEQCEKLPFFVAIYEKRNMRKAAMALNMTQPPLSYAIKQLEEALQVSLFIRTKKGVTPTPAADILYQFSKVTLKKMEQLETQVQQPDDPMAGLMAVGTYDSIARYFWPKIFNESTNRFPNLNLKLSSHRTNENINRILSKEIDYSILVEPAAFKNSDNLHKSILYTDTYSIFSKSKLTKNKLNFIYVVGAHVNDSQNLEDVLRPHLESFQQFKLDSFEVCREFIKKGLGIGVLPNRVAAEDLDSGLIKRISFKNMSRHFGEHNIYECYLRENQDKEKFEKFSAVIRDVLAQPL